MKRKNVQTDSYNVVQVARRSNVSSLRLYLVAYYPPITRKRSKRCDELELSTTARWGNPAKCLAQMHIT